MAENEKKGAPKKCPLQLIRRAGGFATADGFARSVGIPTTTLRRYEQSPASPDTNIPMKPAWIMADKLDCTIDELVGRTPFEGICTPRQRTYPNLSKSSQNMLNEYIGFLLFRDRLLRLNSPENATDG